MRDSTVLVTFIPLLFSVVIYLCLSVDKGKIRVWRVRGKSVCYSGKFLLYFKILRKA